MMINNTAGGTDQAREDALRLEKLRASHSSHHTAGGCAESLPPGETHSDHALRVKAYELWQARGAVHGADQDDWFRAEELLLQQPAEDTKPGQVASTLEQISGAIADGMHSVVDLASTAGHAIAGIFGSHSEDPKKTE